MRLYHLVNVMCICTEKTNRSIVVKQVEDKAVNVDKQQKIVDVIDKKDLPVNGAYCLYSVVTAMARLPVNLACRKMFFLVKYFLAKVENLG